MKVATVHVVDITPFGDVTLRIGNGETFNLRPGDSLEVNLHIQPD